jgi:DNA-binding transcriptional ArsR family regulator
VTRKLIERPTRQTAVVEEAHGEDALRRLSDQFRALADPGRLQILLHLAGGGEVSVTELCEVLNRPQSNTSHHVATLRRAGLVVRQRRGKNNLYRLSAGPIRQLAARLTQLARG